MTTQRFFIGTLIVIALIVVLAISFSSFSTDNSDQQQDVTVTATPDEHPIRAQAQRYWVGVISQLAESAEAMRFAGKSLDAGDLVSAQQFIMKAQDVAHNAFEAAEQSTPDSSDQWTTAQSDLMDAAGQYKDAIGKLSDAIDNGSTRELAESTADIGNARAAVDEATHDVRTWYVAHGGKWSDITDIDAEIKAADKLLDVLTSSQ